MKTKRCMVVALLAAILLALLALSVSAVTYKLETNLTTGSGSTTHYAGWNVTIGTSGSYTIAAQALTSMTATKYSWRTCTNGADIVNGTIDANGHLSFSATLSVGCYELLAHNNGASYNGFNGGGSTPINGGTINLTDGLDGSDAPNQDVQSSVSWIANFKTLNITSTGAAASDLYVSYNVTPLSPQVYSPNKKYNFTIQLNSSALPNIQNASLFLNNDRYAMHNDTPDNYTTGITGILAGTYNITIQACNTTSACSTINLTSYTITSFEVTNCTNMTSHPYVLINTTFKNVVTLDAINATTSTLITFYYDNTSNTVLFSQAYTNIKSTQVCANAIPTTANGNIEYQDTEANFSSNNYALVNSEISTPQLLTLYLIPSSTPVTITVVDSTGSPISGELVYAQTILPGTTTYVTVSSATTGYDGKTSLNLKPYSYYKFVMYSSTGTLDLTTTPVQITSSTYTFTVNVQDPVLTNYELVKQASCQVYYNNATKNARFDWSIPTSQNVHACLEITSTGALSNLLTSSCTSSASGTILIPFDATSGTYAISARMSFGSTPVMPPFYSCGDAVIIDYGSNQLPKYTDESSTKYLGLFIGLILFIFLTLLGAWNPIISIFLGIIALLVSYLIGIIYFGTASTTIAVIAGLVIVGMIAIYRMKWGYG